VLKILVPKGTKHLYLLLISTTTLFVGSTSKHKRNTTRHNRSTLRGTKRPVLCGVGVLTEISAGYAGSNCSIIAGIVGAVPVLNFVTSSSLLVDPPLRAACRRNCWKNSRYFRGDEYTQIKSSGIFFWPADFIKTLNFGFEWWASSSFRWMRFLRMMKLSHREIRWMALTNNK
jgi:hypothetical protein